MINAIRYPTRLSVFGIFTLIQALLIIPAVVIFRIIGDIPHEGGSRAAIGMLDEYTFYAAVVTAIAVCLFLFLSRRSPASYTLSLSFMCFPILVVMCFLLTTFGITPYEWGKYPQIFVLQYSAPLIIITGVVVSIIKIITAIRSRDLLNNKE